MRYTQLWGGEGGGRRKSWETDRHEAIMSRINQFCWLIISDQLLQPKSCLDLPVLETYSYQSNTFVDAGCKVLTIIRLKKVEDEGKEPSISIR